VKWVLPYGMGAWALLAAQFDALRAPSEVRITRPETVA